MATNPAFPNLMLQELKRATDKFGPIHSSHEGYAVIKEELDEFWDVVKGHQVGDHRERALEELVQTATMCWRAAIDLGLTE